MITPKMKEDFYTDSRRKQAALHSDRISEIYREKGTQKRRELILELLQAELLSGMKTVGSV